MGRVGTGEAGDRCVARHVQQPEVPQQPRRTVQAAGGLARSAQPWLQRGHSQGDGADATGYAGGKDAGRRWLEFRRSVRAVFFRTASERGDAYWCTAPRGSRVHLRRLLRAVPGTVGFSVRVNQWKGESGMATRAMEQSKVVSPAEWLAARKELLKKEKEFTRLRDQLSQQRREMPWEKVEKSYVFDGPDGKETLADLFGGRSQLVVYHFMFGPNWKEGCPSCSFLMDHVNGTVPHWNARDVTLAAVSRATFSKIEGFKKRMGWQFPWVSSFGNDFNRDFHVSFTKEEMAQGKVNYNYTMQEFPSEEAPGFSVFYKDASGHVFHTYSTYGRGLEQLVGTY